MKNDNEIIKQIILQFIPYSVVILFGSRARNDNTDDSDYDILVITENDLSVEQSREYKARIRRKLALQKIPADILIQSRNEIEIKKKTTGHIVKKALSEGIII